MKVKEFGPPEARPWRPLWILDNEENIIMRKSDEKIKMKYPNYSFLREWNSDECSIAMSHLIKRNRQEKTNRGTLKAIRILLTELPNQYEILDSYNNT